MIIVWVSDFGRIRNTYLFVNYKMVALLKMQEFEKKIFCLSSWENDIHSLSTRRSKFTLNTNKIVLAKITPRKYISAETAVQRCSKEKVLWKYAANLLERLLPKCDFSKVAKQLYWNHTSAWVLSCKFGAYFQDTFS